MLDTACTRHISNEQSHSRHFVEQSGIVQVGNRETVELYVYGMGRVRTTVNGGSHWIILENVIYSPKFMFNLISMSRVRRHGFKIPIDEDDHNSGNRTMELLHKTNEDVEMLGLETSEGLFQAILQVEDYDRTHVTRTSGQNILHRRLVHVANGKIRDSLPHVRGIPEREVDTARVCDDCNSSKSLRSPRKPVALED